MSDRLSRRAFLKLGTLSPAALLPTSRIDWLPGFDQQPPFGLGRITIDYLRIYAHPDYRSKSLGWRRRDEVLELHEQVQSISGPKHNPRWYRVTGGYAHSAHIQRVDGAYENQPASQIPSNGQLGELTVPYSHSLRQVSSNYWEKLYRLYFGSVHWVTGIVTGPDGQPWYEITDDLLHVRFCVPASHIRLIDPAEHAPLASHVPADEKHIQISLARQRLSAFEGSRLVFQASISSGVSSHGPTDNGIPTDTPRGRFRIATKMPSRHMGDGEITGDYQAYELLGVPWCCFFVSTGVALHGTYWHDNFGARMSQGCVNLKNADALWLYRWTTPPVNATDWYARGMGTLVEVI